MTIAMSPPASTRDLPFTGRTRWLAAASFLTGALLQLAEFLLEPQSSTTAGRIDWWLANPGRMDFSQAAGIAAIPFLLLGAAMMWRLARADSPKLAGIALVVIATAMIGLGVVHGIELGARWAAIAGNSGAAQAVLDANDPRVPGIVTVVMFLPMAVIGNLLMAVALFRSRFVPRAVAIGLAAFVILDFVADLGVISHAVTVAVGLVLAWSIVSGFQRNAPARRSSAAD